MCVWERESYLSITPGSTVNPLTGPHVNYSTFIHNVLLEQFLIREVDRVIWCTNTQLYTNTENHFCNTFKGRSFAKWIISTFWTFEWLNQKSMTLTQRCVRISIILGFNNAGEDECSKELKGDDLSCGSCLCHGCAMLGYENENPCWMSIMFLVILTDSRHIYRYPKDKQKTWRAAWWCSKAEVWQCFFYFTFAPRVEKKVKPCVIGLVNSASVRWHHQHSQTVLANDCVRWTVQRQQHFILRSLLAEPPLGSDFTLLLNLDLHLIILTWRDMRNVVIPLIRRCNV